MRKKAETVNEIQFSDIFDLKDIQSIQDLFADATGVASIITRPDGTPITHPSNFCRLCNEIIRKTDIGLTNCFKSDAEIGRPNPSGPVIQPCLSGGLWDAGASIIVGGKHIANWLIGQVKNEELDHQQMLQYAKVIGADQEDFMNALEEVPLMSKEKFEKVAQMLFAFASEISSKAYQNSQLIQSILERRRAEEELTQEQYLVNALLNNLPDHIYFKDRESRFIRINVSHAKSLGLTNPDQAVGKTDFDFHTPEHAHLAYNDEQTIIQTGQPLSKEVKLMWPDRPNTWFSTTKLPMCNKEGKIIGTFGISRDITKRKLAEEALQESEEHYRILFNEALNGICLADAETGLVIDCNQAMLSLVGRQREELIGQSQKILHPPNDSKAAYSPEFEQHLHDKEGKTLETQVVTSTGIIREVEIKANHVIINGRKALQGVFRDITESKQAEEELAHEQYLMDAIMNNLPDHIYFKDRESRFTRINKSQAQFFGLNDSDQAVGKTDFDFFTGEHAQQAYKDEQTIIRTGQLLSIEEKETHHDRPDTWVSTIKLPLCDKKGSIIGTFGISKDITKRKLAEEAMWESEEHYRNLFNEAMDGICLVDEETGLIIDCNQALSSLVGRERVELIGQSQKILHPPNDSKAAYSPEFEQHLHDKEGKTLETQIVTSTGIIREVEIKANHVNIHGRKTLQGVFRDITERKQAEEEIKLKNELLQTINAEKDKFFSIIAHDLRGPLSAFVAATQMLTEEIQTMDIEEIKDITLSMKTSASNIYSLLENLLEWSRLRRDVMDFVPEKLNLKKKIEACIDVLSESAREKQIEIAISIPDELEVLADNHMFDTITRNLLSNAIKFTPVGGNVSVTADYNSDHSIEVKVSDSGIGMTPELKNKLFLISEKTSRPGTEGEMGTGLGLLLVKEFIEKHGGKIWVDSEVGKGSTFSFTIGQFENLKMR